VSSNHLDDYNFFSNGPDGADTGFGWDELPPTFMGTTSSFGQQPQIGSHEVPNLNFNNDMNTRVKAEAPLPPATSADVLAAATLLQNGSNGRSHNMGDGSIFAGQDMPIPPTNGRARPQSMSQYQPHRQFNPGRTSSEQYPGDSYFADVAVFGGRQIGQQRPSNQKMDIRWGSDASFGATQGFLSPHNETDKEIERVQNNTLENAFTLDREAPSAHNSRPPSPFKGHRKTKSLGPINTQTEEDSRPRKRRKSKFPEDDGEDDEPPISAQPGNRKRKSNKKGANDSPTVDTDPGHKRRKSAAAGAAAAKAARENLTEDQKRENHIKSEQKRRTLIREGFEDLGELVPGLRGGGFSKSAVLIMAADWLEELINGNQVLRGRLDQMEGR